MSCSNSSGPFPHFLKSRGFGLTLASFRLTGNIAETASGRLIEQPEVTALLGDFFDAQADWQSVTDGAGEALASLGDRAEIVLLTAMPHRHRAARRAHLDALGLPYPLLTTEMAKGPAVAKLRGKQAAGRWPSSTTSRTTSSRRATRSPTRICSI